jgi:Cu/Ag efflux protein CusF
MLAQGKPRLALFLIILAASGAFFLTSAGRGEEEKPEPRPPLAKGPIEKIDLVHQLLTLKTRGGLETFTWTESTYIFRGKEKISADKLKPGEIIALRYYTGDQGQRLVQRIKASTNDQATATGALTEPPK